MLPMPSLEHLFINIGKRNETQQLPSLNQKTPNFKNNPKKKSQKLLKQTFLKP
jgi:hypothetical protein